MTSFFCRKDIVLAVCRPFLSKAASMMEGQMLGCLLLLGNERLPSENKIKNTASQQCGICNGHKQHLMTPCSSRKLMKCFYIHCATFLTGDSVTKPVYMLTLTYISNPNGNPCHHGSSHSCDLSGVLKMYSETLSEQMCKA